MNINLPLILVILTAVTGIIWLTDKILLAKMRAKKNAAVSLLVDYGRSLFSVFLLVLVIRSFVAQAYVVPTGSLEPTIKPVEFILVNQFSYGIKLPVLNTKIVSVGEPKRGDIAVFRYPPKPNVDLIKRVIGIPGDHVVYYNKQLTINGQLISQKFLYSRIDTGEAGKEPVNVYEEDLLGVKHKIYIRKTGGQNTNYDIIVPEGKYFMMGDNRDGSADSRLWGFAAEKDLVGKGIIILMSYKGKFPHIEKFRWDRIGTKL